MTLGLGRIKILIMAKNLTTFGVIAALVAGPAVTVKLCRNNHLAELRRESDANKKLLHSLKLEQDVTKQYESRIKYLESGGDPKSCDYTSREICGNCSSCNE